MSGVTVATISRSMLFGSAPAISSARRAAGRQMSVSASSSAAIRRSRMPVRSTIHSSFVSTSFDRSSFVSTRSGTWHAEPGDRDRRPVVRPITSLLPDREGERPAHGELAVDGRLHLAAPDRPAHGLDVALEREHVARPHDALEAHVVDAGEEGELAAVLLLREHGDGAALRERLDHLHARHDRVAGEVAGAVLLGHGLARDDALARDELDHLVDQEHRVAVRQDASIAALSMDRAAAASTSPDSSPLAQTRCGRGGRSTWRCRPAARSPARSPRTGRRSRPAARRRAPAPRAAPRGSGRARAAPPTRRARAPGRRPRRRAGPRRAARCAAARPSAPGRRPCTC